MADAIAVIEARLDALKRRCSTGYGCGSTCISVKKECRSEGKASTSRERIQRLEQLARGEIKPRGLGVPKVAEARALVEEIQARRGQRAHELRAQRSERTEGLIPTDQPFSPELEARIKRGIEKRSTTTGGVNYTSKDLAEALVKVAQSPGGKNMRKALAFMEEAGILCNIAAEFKQEIPRVTGKDVDSLPWTRPLELAKVVRDLGLVSDERLAWMKQDKTVDGRILVRNAEIVRNPPRPSEEEKRTKVVYEESKLKYREAEARFEQSVKDGWRFPEDKKDALWSEKLTVDQARKNYAVHRDGRLNMIKWAAHDFLSGNMAAYSNENSGGYYRFDQKVYVARAGTGDSWDALYRVSADEIELSRMRDAYTSHISKYLPERLQELRRPNDIDGPIGFGRGLTFAEKALGVHVHELGHAVDSFANISIKSVPAADDPSQSRNVLVHPQYSDRNAADFRPDPIRQVLKEKRGPSSYALTNDNELFAESFAAWAIAPDALKADHPTLYAWVEDRVGKARSIMAKHGELQFLEVW